MTAKNRRELKQKFRTGAQPTAQDYADVFDSGFNALDDGISKPLEPYLPVRIKGNGAGLNILDLYNDDNHHWRISLLSGNDSGYTIADPSGNTHFFMEDGSGNIGLGISKPKAKLHINQSDDAGDALYVEDFANDDTPTRITNAGNIYVRSEVESEIDGANFYVNGDTRIVNETSDQSFMHINRFGGISFNALTTSTSPQVDMHCPLYLHDALVVDSDVEIKGKLTVNQEIDIKSVAQADGGTIQLGDTNGDQVSIPGKLNSGDGDALQINDSLNVHAQFDVGGTAHVQGSVQFDDTLNVSKAFSALSATIAESLSASTLSGNGANISNLNGNNIASGTVPFARLPTDNNKELGTSSVLLPTQSAVKKYIDAEISRIEAAFNTKLQQLESSLLGEVTSVNTRVNNLKIPTGLKWGDVFTPAKYHNSYDHNMDFSFSEGNVMVGAYSHHDNDKEDREWKFRSRTLELEY